jgi:2-polyprenyl-3-methyl-5-hydroxy-6-metoxy-1,4-benzoquinol methylase
MNTNERELDQLLEPYRPTLPLRELVEEVNLLFHAAEAADYDVRHVEIVFQLPAIWTEMIGVAVSSLGGHQLRILDFGCGTGFASEQVLRNLAESQVAHLTCYDPSPEMLAQCRQKMSSRLSNVTFVNDLQTILSGTQRFDLVVSNSVWHHLPEPWSTVGSVSRILTPNAVWVAGHEPSCRFYRNAHCRTAYEEFLGERRWRKLFSPSLYALRLKQALGLLANPAAAAAKMAHEKGLFRVTPSATAVSRLVDFHVAHSADDAESGRGFDFEAIQKQLEGQWKLLWVKSYSFMGAYYEGSIPMKWRATSRRLAEQYPLDGANFSAIWSRC